MRLKHSKQIQRPKLQWLSMPTWWSTSCLELNYSLLTIWFDQKASLFIIKLIRICKYFKTHISKEGFYPNLFGSWPIVSRPDLTVIYAWICGWRICMMQCSKLLRFIPMNVNSRYNSILYLMTLTLTFIVHTGVEETKSMSKF